ncbi:hypothetical protein MLD38_032094 [Melastoma candidum]|uniref:Uncharacterized protein n=1 Tax=Melastoma candidum TaxID=119954 RepID=A0ACB9M6T1_9MYRT|nr:hypothetical protein MLD38_032094 [Melastoma candidum]
MNYQRPDSADLSSAVEDDDNELSSFGVINTQELQGFFSGLTLDVLPIRIAQELNSYEDGNDGEISSVTSIVDGSVNSAGATVGPPPDGHGSRERSWGKNPYARSVLRRIEMKLDDGS